MVKPCQLDLLETVNHFRTQFLLFLMCHVILCQLSNLGLIRHISILKNMLGQNINTYVFWIQSKCRMLTRVAYVRRFLSFILLHAFTEMFHTVLFAPQLQDYLYHMQAFLNTPNGLCQSFGRKIIHKYLCTDINYCNA